MKVWGVVEENSTAYEVGLLFLTLEEAQEALKYIKTQVPWKHEILEFQIRDAEISIPLYVDRLYWLPTPKYDN